MYIITAGLVDPMIIKYMRFKKSVCMLYALCKRFSYDNLY